MDHLALTELTEDERRELARRHPEIGARRPAVVVSADEPDLLRRLRSKLERLDSVSAADEVRDAVAEPPASFATLVETLTPDLEIPSAAAVLQARRNALARKALADEFGLLSSAQVAEVAGSRAKNRAALAHRWTAERRIFSVPHRDKRLWPAFQLGEEGRPIPAVAEVLSALGSEGGGWEVALWFTSASGWLGGRRPVDLLSTDPAAVIEAARREGEGLVF